MLDENNARMSINAPRPIVMPRSYQVVPMSVLNLSE